MASELRVDRIIPTSGVPTGGGGSIVQIVRSTSNTLIQVTANTDTDIISATITPRTATSKILISISVDACRSYVTSNNRARLINKILRGSTLVHDIYEVPQYRNLNFGSSSVEINIPLFFDYLDSPATTSAVTYKYQWASQDGQNFNTAGRTYNMTLMEVSA